MKSQGENLSPSLLYQIDPERSVREQRCVLSVHHSGGKRALVRSPSTLSGEDRKILDVLQREKRESTSTFLLSPSSFSTLCRELSLTGRLFWGENKLSVDLFSPLSLLFKIDFCREEENRFEVTIYVEKRNRLIALSDCHLVASPLPWCVRLPFLSFFVPQLEKRWIRTIAEQGSILFWNQEQVAEMSTIHCNENCREERGWTLELSKAVRDFLEREPEPLPILQLSNPLGTTAQLFFLYKEGERISFAKVSKGEQERAYQADLLQSGYRKHTKSLHAYACSEEKVEEALTLLLAGGWRLEDCLGRPLHLIEQSCFHIQEQSDGFLLTGEIKTEEGESLQLAELIEQREEWGALLVLRQREGTLFLSSSLREIFPILLEAEKRETELFLPKSSWSTLLPLLSQRTFSHESNFLQEWQNLQEDKSSLSLPPMPHFSARLRPYQKKGVQWLCFLQKYSLGGLLADEMGLGKTVQVLAFLSLLPPKRGFCLLVVPASLLFQWKEECARFTPTLPLYLHSGPNRTCRVEELPQEGILLTSYHLLPRDFELFSSLTFDGIILDEAQMIKNRQSQWTSLLCSLQSTFRICLTGTPLENHRGELWTQFHFLNPQLFGSYKQFQTKLLSLQDRGDAWIRRKIAPLFLRRLKEEVAGDLPEKMEQEILIDFSPEERALYQKVLLKSRREFTVIKTQERRNRQRFHLFTLLLRLRQICCDTRLLPTEEGQPPFSLSSSKCEQVVKEVLSLIEGGRKVLLYSQFTTMLHLLQERFIQEGLSPLLLDGKSRNREQLVHRFQREEGYPLFLLSLKAGGLGLNLTAADYVLLYDPWWNGAVENQAIDRAHRIGQTKRVIVRRYLVRESIEEQIGQIQRKKQKLFCDLFENQEEGEGEENSLSLKEMEELLYKEKL